MDDRTSPPAGDPDGGVYFPYRRETLDNGLEVILHEDRSTPVVAVHLMYHVGSKDERPGRTGFAHLFEHLLFQGSENVPKGEHFRLVQNAGGTLNGSTWFDRTNYFEILPSNQLDLALWLESDRMGHFLPSITQEKLDNQRGVVKNERRQAYENRPYGLAFEEALHAAFDEGHPYRHPTIGYMEDLDAADLGDVRDFFRDYYGPNNATLVLAGDFDADDALDRVERYFGPFEARETPPPVEVPEVEAPGERRAELTDQVAVPRVYLMYHAPSYRDDAFEAADVLTSLLADGKSSRLHRELVYERQVAAEAQAFTWPTEETGMVWAVVTARPGVSADRLEEATRSVLDEAREEGFSEDEAAGARHRAERSLVGQLNSVGGRADAFAHAAVLRDEPGYVNEVFERYDRVGREEVDRLAREVLRPERLTVTRVVPESDEVPADDEEVETPAVAGRPGGSQA